MALRRGFKAEANYLARMLRSELGLLFKAPLNPWKLAEHLEIPILTLSEMRESVPLAVNYLSTRGNDEFSAVTIFEGTRRVILHNDNHTIGRQASDIAHELAHGILLHPPHEAITASGDRYCDPVMEEEANWLSAALLISEEAAVEIAKLNLSIPEAAERYGVSKKMIDFRLRVTGARKRAAFINAR
jgi:Zn-dependent peptidase ImmA (M78 family)